MLDMIRPAGWAPASRKESKKPLASLRNSPKQNPVQAQPIRANKRRAV
jgi:hypothetical protein